jgi:hypothetical protein
MLPSAGNVIVWLPIPTVIEKVAVVVPPALAAVIVNVSEAAAATGVPEIKPVEVLKLIPLRGVTAMLGEIE